MPSNSRYESLLTLSHMVPTFYPTLPGTVGPASGAPAIELADPDLKARAQRLVNVLYWTARHFEAKGLEGLDDPSVLKVFITPEFYFRKASAHEAHTGRFVPGTSFGSYPEDARYELAEAVYGAIQVSPLFKDWVIVAGTICSVLPPDGTGRMNLLNTAIMLRGQREEMDESVPYILMEKHYISNIDGPNPQAHANLDPTTTYSFHLNPDQHLDNIQYWDDMKVGLEVCLDHSMQVAANAMNLISHTVGLQTLDLQLVTSCGMSIVDPAVAVSDGALVMLTDGMSHVANNVPEPIFQVGRYDTASGITTMFPATAFEFGELPGVSNYQVLDYARGAYVRRKRRQGVWASRTPFPMLVD